MLCARIQDQTNSVAEKKERLKKKRPLLNKVSSLNQGQLVGGNVEGIDIGGQAGVGLLGAVRADQGVDLDGVNVVELLEGQLDLGLVGLDIDDEDQGVVLLHLLHGALSVERVDDDLVLIKTGDVVDGLAGVARSAGQDQSLEDLLLVQALATPGHALFFFPKEKKRECGSGKLVNLGSRGNSLEMPSLWKTSSVLTEPGVSKKRYY